jgi:diguanylate cyclase (GGDEF)-like protein
VVESGAVVESGRDPGHGDDPGRSGDPVRGAPASTWRLIAGLFGLVALLLIIDIVRMPGPDPLGWAIAIGLAALAVLAVAYHRQVLAFAERQRAEAESLNRMLQGLARSTSPDAVLTGIVEELRTATGADHCVIVRSRPRSRLLDAILISGSVGVPAATTTMPSVLLEITPDETDNPELAATRISTAAGEFFGLQNRRAAPLVTSQGVVGALVLSRRTGERWRPGALRLLADAAREASAALERANLFAATEAAATTDQLTGLPNRRFLEILASRPAGRRKDDATAVLMADIDHFKRLNDRFGHPAGDTVLRAVADAIARTVRTDDFPIRYGGEEFLVVLRRADRHIATAVAERLRRNVAGVDLRRVRITQPVTVSVGVAVAERPGEELGTLIERADAALFRAKAAGRDRIAQS